MVFQTGQYESQDTVPKRLGQAVEAKGQLKKEVLRKNDLQERVATKHPKDYLDLSGSKALTELTKFLDSLIKILNAWYLQGRKPDMDSGTQGLRKADDLRGSELFTDNISMSAPSGTLNHT